MPGLILFFFLIRKSGDGAAYRVEHHVADGVVPVEVARVAHKREVHLGDFPKNTNDDGGCDREEPNSLVVVLRVVRKVQDLDLQQRD